MKAIKTLAGEGNLAIQIRKRNTTNSKPEILEMLNSVDYSCNYMDPESEKNFVAGLATESLVPKDGFWRKSLESIVRSVLIRFDSS